MKTEKHLPLQIQFRFAEEKNPNPTAYVLLHVPTHCPCLKIKQDIFKCDLHVGCCDKIRYTCICEKIKSYG